MSGIPLHLCRYSKWGEPVGTYNNGHKQQWRACVVCNKAQFRTLRWDNQTTLTSVLHSLQSAFAQEATK